MQVKVKKLNENAIIPKYAHSTDAGLDLVAVSSTYDNYGNIVYDTGLAFEIPEGYVGLIFPRSSISKYDLRLSNAVGIIDSGYRGNVMFKFKPTNKSHEFYKVGDKIGQLIIIPYPKIELIESEELSDSDRGKGGFGSTGN